MALTEAEWLACYRRVEQPLYNVLYRWLWQAQDCQDLMQDTFMRIWDRSASIEPATVDALVYATALNLARNKLRWRGLWRLQAPDETTPSNDPGPDQDAERQARRQSLREALAQLPDAARNLILLSEFAGLTTEELATVLAIPAGTVASRKHHALARLRALLRGDDR